MTVQINKLFGEIESERSVLFKGNGYYLWKLRKKVRELIWERFWLMQEIENRSN
ncbi:MAG: hypothetical protein IH950_16335 [Bacteroidetes bacterium]|nr:hypothetical protein [Bacteroidota bacterium]